MFYLISTLSFGIPVLYWYWYSSWKSKVDRLLTGQTAQQKGTTDRWYSNKTSLTLTKLQQTESWCKCRQTSEKRKVYKILNLVYLLVHTLALCSRNNLVKNIESISSVRVTSYKKICWCERCCNILKWGTLKTEATRGQLN